MDLDNEDWGRPLRGSLTNDRQQNNRSNNRGFASIIPISKKESKC